MVIAVFLTVDGNFRYAVDMEGYGALQFFNEEKLSVTPARPNTTHKAGWPRSLGAPKTCCGACEVMYVADSPAQLRFMTMPSK